MLDAMHETTHSLRLELRVSGDSLVGSIVDEHGARVEFTGRIGLLALVDSLVHPDPHDLSVAPTASA